MRNVFRLIFLMAAFYLVVVVYSPANAEEVENHIPAQPGQLDLNGYDAPLSYIDRANDKYEYTRDDQERFDRSNEYVQESKRQVELDKQKALGQIDDLIDEVKKTKKAFDEARQSYNPNSYTIYQDNPYYKPDPNFSTDPRDDIQYYRRYRHYDDYGHTYYYGKPVHGRYHYPYGGYMGYQPYINILNVPGYMGNKENEYNGKDDDGDNFIDEGFHKGNVQIILGDSGVSKDDVWALYVDGNYMGTNEQGFIRNWDLSLYSGTHSVAIVGLNIPDDSGTYSIIFRNASVVSGPPLVGENLKQGQRLEWLIKVM